MSTVIAQAAVMEEIGAPLTLTEIVVDDVAPNEVLVRTIASGVCHTDHTVWTGGMPISRTTPLLLGHEVAGIVEKVGSAVSRTRPGDHVVTCATAFCGYCDMCQRGLQQHCTDAKRDRPAEAAPRLTQGGRRVTPFVGLGGFASHMLVSEQVIAPIPEEMPLDKAALLGCAVHTGVGAVRHTAKVGLGDTVAVIGCGGVGLNVVQGAKLAGASRVIAVDLVRAKLERACAFGATDVVDGSTVDPVEAVLDLVAGGVDHAFEVVGRGATVAQAYGMTRNAGATTVVGLGRVGETFTLPLGALMTERRLQGSKLGKSFLSDIAWYCQEYLAGRLLLDELVSRTIDLDDVSESLEHLESSDLARSVITFA
jgi:S-(hydroxymethyl)glutathione dehydrogenase/alcohol dehydrogenase